MLFWLFAGAAVDVPDTTEVFVEAPRSYALVLAPPKALPAGRAHKGVITAFLAPLRALLGGLARLFRLGRRA